MKRILSLLLTLILILGAVLTIKFFADSHTAEKTVFAMNTVIKITASGQNTAAAVNDAIEEIYRIDALMSAHNPTSEIYALNTNEKTAVSKEVFDLIKTAKEIWQKTDGAFDITLKPVSDLWNIQSENPAVPEKAQIESSLEKTGFENVILEEDTFTVSFEKPGMALDLGAIAKGYAADRAVLMLKKHGIKSALVDLGGNLYAIGKNGCKRWKIGLQTPWENRGEYFETVEAENTSVVTSGAYERYFEKDGKIYHHILNPKTGYPAEGDTASVSVICESSTLADALSTAVFVSGEVGAKKAKSAFENVEIIIMTADGTVKRY